MPTNNEPQSGHQFISSRNLYELETKKSKMYYKNEPVDNYDYQDQPHEIAAREAEETLYKKYYEERLESVL